MPKRGQHPGNVVDRNTGLFFSVSIFILSLRIL